MQKKIVRYTLVLIVPLLVVLALILRVGAEESAPPGKAPRPKGTPTVSKSGMPNGHEKFATAESCVECHAGKVKSFEHTLHGKKTDARTPAAQHACDTCHGSGVAHADGDEDKPPILFGPKSRLSIREQNDVCLKCHETSRNHVFWQGSVHETRNVGCVSCHQVHGSNPKLMAKPDQTELCTKCHIRTKSEVQMAFHHPIREGAINCSDCHNPHGTVADKLVTANVVNEKCYQCHADKRGPFLWNHAPVSENCLNCHNPHGSRHDNLLTARGPLLCQRCHSGEGHQGILYTTNMFPPATASSVYKLRPQLYNRSCWNCHVAIHGSQSPSGNTFLR